MAPKTKNDQSEEAGANALPAAVVAQAEAAILGNFEDDPSARERRPSRAAKPDYSQYQNTNQPSGSQGPGLSK